MTNYCYGCKFAKNDCKDAPEYIHKRCTYYNNEAGRIKTEEEIKEKASKEMKAEDRE